MRQLGLRLNPLAKKTRKREILDAMERVVPRDALVPMVSPGYPKADIARRPFGVDSILDNRYLRQWFALSELAI